MMPRTANIDELDALRAVPGVVRTTNVDEECVDFVSLSQVDLIVAALGRLLGQI